MRRGYRSAIDRISRQLGNRQIEAYLEDRDLKEHERRQLEIIAREFPQFAGSAMDLGCATGALLKALGERYPDAELTGVDIAPALLDGARDRVPNARFVQADLEVFEPDEPVDLITASGLLSIFEDFAEPLDRWLSWLAPGGRLFVFGQFNSSNVDRIVRFRNNDFGGEWEGGFTAYSVETVGAHLDSSGWSYEFERFELPIDLPKGENPIRVHTARVGDQRLLLNGANLVCEMFFLTVRA